MDQTNSANAPVVRFAPSPTGFLHIGGARTALFNWLFARHEGGRFLLRIEDTDRARSAEEAVQAILDGLKWLELDWEGDPVFQSHWRQEHAEAAMRLLAAGNAYRCYCSAEELEAMRAQARAEKKPIRYDGRWRDRDPAEAPTGVAPVIRFRAPRDGSVTVPDLIQGDVTTAHENMDDLILLRADGTPTYTLSVVVDDQRMGITHVIRGDDHLTNAARQSLLYEALGWPPPIFAHVPLIHGADGAKLSKRHGAVSISAWRDEGYLPAAMRNYLARLGWSHGDDEFFTTEQAVGWFSPEAIGVSPARFDAAKLSHLNGLHIRAADDAELTRLVAERHPESLTPAQSESLRALMPSLKQRAKTLAELAENAAFLFATRPIVPDSAAEKLLGDDSRRELAALADSLAAAPDWTAASIEEAVRARAGEQALELKALAQPLRAALTGRGVSPGIFEVMAVLGREETLARLRDQAAETTGDNPGKN